MKINIFKDDYNVKSLLKIKTKTANLPMYVTPRYLSHYLKNEYEPFSVTVLQNLIKDKDTFLDIGAHYGFFSLIAHQQQPSINIIAVEAVKKNCQILKKNFELNSIKNYSAFCQAVSDKKTSKNFFITNASDSSSFHPHPLAKTIKKIEVQTNTIDHLVNNKPIDLIKIDVEGHEIPVLNGAKKTIKNNSCPLIIEFNPSSQLFAGHKPQELLELLTLADYDIFIIGENSQKLYLIDISLQDWTRIIGVDSFFMDYIYFNLLCLKKNSYSKNLFINKHKKNVSTSTDQNYVFKKLIQMNTEQQEKERKLHLKFKKEYGLISKELVKTQEEYYKIRKELVNTQKNLKNTYKNYLKIINQPQNKTIWLIKKFFKIK